jgi:hypothetical protein
LFSFIYQLDGENTYDDYLAKKQWGALAATMVPLNTTSNLLALSLVQYLSELELDGQTPTWTQMSEVLRKRQDLEKIALFFVSRNQNLSFF